MQIATGKFVEGFCKNTVYRFLNAAKTNWEKFVCALSERIINRTIRPLTSEERKDVFIFDDTMFSRTGGKKTELCSRVFDHVTMKYLRGYRLLTLGWSDGNSFLPIAGRLLASNKEKNIVGPKHPADRRSLAGKRRNEDDRTIGELFLMMVDELADTTFAHAMQFIVDAMLQTVREHFGLSDEQLLVFSQQFYDRLPASYQRFLQPPTTA